MDIKQAEENPDKERALYIKALLEQALNEANQLIECRESRRLIITSGLAIERVNEYLENI